MIDTLERRSSVFMAVSAILTAVATSFLAYLTFSLADDSARQAEVAKRSLHAIEDQLAEMRKASRDNHDSTRAALYQSRPWVTAPEIIKGSCSTPNENRIDDGFILRFKNEGKTPSKGFAVMAGIISAKGEKWKSDIDELCNLSVDLFENRSFFAYTSIVPGGSLALTRSLTKDFRTIDFTKIRPENLTSIEEPSIAGCAIYGSIFDTSPHHTGFLTHITINGAVTTMCADDATAITPD